MITRLAAQMEIKWKITLARILALIFVIAISVFIFSIRDQAEQWAVYGYPGIFLIAFLAYGTVLLPAPGVAIVFAMGGILNPLGVALAAGAGGALGEMSGYLAGFSGQAVVEGSPTHARLTRWMQANGPNYCLASSSHTQSIFRPRWNCRRHAQDALPRFLLWVWIGVTIKMLIFAFAGYFSLPLIFSS
jgi:hypothetical protein